MQACSTDVAISATNGDRWRYTINKAQEIENGENIGEPLETARAESLLRHYLAHRLRCGGASHSGMQMVQAETPVCSGTLYPELLCIDHLSASTAASMGKVNQKVAP